MAKTSRQKIITKKHLARVEREQMQTRYIIIGCAILLLLVVGFVGYGIVDQLVIKPNQPVASVNGNEISAREFQALARYQRSNIVQQWMQYYQFMQMFGSDPQTQQYFKQNLDQIAAQLDDTATLGQQVVDELINIRLIREEAAKRGITVSEEEIDLALQEGYGYYPDGTPTPTATRPVIAPSTLSPTQLAMITATPTITPTATPTITATSTPIPLPTSTPSGPMTPTATATAYTESLFKDNLNQTLDYFSGIKVSEAQFREILRDQLLRKKVLDAVVGELPHEEEQVWMRQIVVTSEITATQVISRLNAGEDFGALAVEFSIDTSASQGGDLGWINSTDLTSQYTEEVATLAFGLEIGKVSPVIPTADGRWFIIQVINREIKPISDTVYDQTREQKFQDWLLAQRETNDVQVFDTWKDFVPAEPTLPAVDTSGSTGQ